MLLLREARSYIKPTNRVSHTNKYTDHKKLAVVQTQMTSEKISGTGAPTIEQQASQMLHQDEGSGPALSVVGHGLGVQKDRNPRSCDDRKGYSTKDQCFLEHFFQKTGTHYSEHGNTCNSYEEHRSQLWTAKWRWILATCSLIWSPNCATIPIRQMQNATEAAHSCPTERHN